MSEGVRTSASSIQVPFVKRSLQTSTRSSLFILLAEMFRIRRLGSQVLAGEVCSRHDAKRSPQTLTPIITMRGIEKSSLILRFLVAAIGLNWHSGYDTDASGGRPGPWYSSMLWCPHRINVFSTTSLLPSFSGDVMRRLSR